MYGNDLIGLWERTDKREDVSKLGTVVYVLTTEL